MKDGHLDNIFDVLDAHSHPSIIMGRFALGWMGTEVFPEQVSPHIVQRALKLGSKGAIIAHETSGNTQTLEHGNGGEK